MSPSGPWKTREIPDGRWIRQDFGPLGVIVMNYRSEWQIARFPEGAPDGLGEEGDASGIKHAFEWERWDRDPADTKFHFRPGFPGLPVVARPRGALNLSPRAKAVFYVGIPASIMLFGECQGKMVCLTEIPSEPLSKTWHGSPLVGNLGYALQTHARRYFDAEAWPDHEIVCTISVVNDSDDHMPFERLYIETQHLAVFEKEGKLWGNAARMRQAADKKNVTDVTYSQRPASPYQDALEITPPRMGRCRKSSMQSAFSKVFGHFNPIADAS